MTGPTAAVFIAHVLAAHLSVPEPVRLQLVEEIGPHGFERQQDWPIATVRRDGPGWLIEYERSYWQHHPGRRSYTLVHELCHAAYDYDVADWFALPAKERVHRHARVEQCAAQILREHRRCHAPE